MKDQQSYPSDELLINYLLGECPAHEVLALEQWITTHTEDARRLDHFKKIWDESARLAYTGILDTDEAWARLKPRLLAPKPRSLAFSTRRVLSWAAVLIALGMLALGYKLWVQAPKMTPTLSQETQPLIQKFSGASRLLDTLPDQSLITLNRNSELQYPAQFTKHERRVRLTGEAFFDVSHDTSKPFYVEARQAVEIRVLGTSFNVKSFTDYTEVLVESGRVQVKHAGRIVILHPGEMVRIREKDSVMQVQKQSDKLYRYFRNRYFECDGTPLWRVVEVLNEAYGDSVRIGRSSIRSLTLTTRFDEQALEQVLEVICETFDLQLEKKEGKYVLY